MDKATAPKAAQFSATWAQEDPAAAAGWVASLPAGDLAVNAATNVARKGGLMFQKVNVPLLGVAENMMSGVVWVKGNASESAGATGNGGLLVIDGDASSRCGISMKGIDIVVGGVGTGGFTVTVKRFLQEGAA